MSSPAAAQALPEFIFVICQHGSEKTLRAEVLANHPNLKLAFSRPGFVTFKVAEAGSLPETFTLKSTLARTWGWALGKCSGETADALIPQIAESPQLADCSHLHVWQRDPVLPGKNGFEPGCSALADDVGQRIATASAQARLDVNRVASPDDRVFDVVLVEPNEWWYGYHIASHVAGRWPGGVPPMDTNIETVSRAYFKLKEALLWSGITIKPGDFCAEIGSAPGGACQLLLEMGATVIGIDPAEMEDEILKHENFTHVRKRSSEVRKKDFAKVKWLISDMSVTPTYTVDAVEEIVAHDRVSVTGIVMTMKLTDWKLVDEIPALMGRVRKLGFKFVRVRQLAFNRREFCMVAVKDKFALRKAKRTKKPAKPTDPKPDAAPKSQTEAPPLAPTPESSTPSKTTTTPENTPTPES